MPASKIDRDLLIDFFYTVGPCKPIREPKIQYKFGGRLCEIFKSGPRDWRGWFYDDHAVEFGAETKVKLLAELESSA